MDSHYEDSKVVVKNYDTEIELAKIFRTMMSGYDEKFDEEMVMLTNCRAFAQLEVSMTDVLNEMSVIQERHKALMDGDINSDVDDIMYDLMYSLITYFRSLAIVKDGQAGRRLNLYGDSCTKTNKGINSYLSVLKRDIIDESLSIGKRLEAYRRYRVLYAQCVKRDVRKYDMNKFIDACLFLELLDE